LNFTLTTSLGALDLPGEITGGGGYEDLLPATVQLKLFGVACSCLGLRRLIEVKRAASRPKDLDAIAGTGIAARGKREKLILLLSE
jgi:hypothetical protein